MIRKGYYCKYKNKVFMCDLDYSTVLLRSHDIEDLEKNGFEKNPYFGQNKFSDLGRYIKEVPLEEVEWFCRIGNRGKYKGRRVGIIGETDTEYVITSGYVPEGEQLFTEANGFEQIDRYLFEGKVPKSEVTDMVEIKEPICKELKAPDDWNF
ncbi:hypothetical protein ACTQ3M_10990 [Oscillospiraceae bacterium LCP25S3_E10]